MSKRLALTAVVCALLAFAGCGKAPEQEMQMANTAIEAAKTAEAEKYVPDIYQMAMDTLNAAMAARQETDSKFALFRSYGKSKEMFLRAEALANEATDAAQAEKERVKTEVLNLLAQAREALDSANAALSKAPRGKGSKADIELIKNDFNAANLTYQEASSDYEAGKYAAAKTKLDGVIRKAQSILEEIKKAAAKKIGK